MFVNDKNKWNAYFTPRKVERIIIKTQRNIRMQRK